MDTEAVLGLIVGVLAGLLVLPLLIGGIAGTVSGLLSRLHWVVRGLGNLHGDGPLDLDSAVHTLGACFVARRLLVSGAAIGAAILWVLDTVGELGALGIVGVAWVGGSLIIVVGWTRMRRSKARGGYGPNDESIGLL